MFRFFLLSINFIVLLINFFSFWLEKATLVAHMGFMDDFGPKMLALTDKERLFVQHYVLTGGVNGTASAIAAGYSDVKRGAHVSAHRILNRESVLEAIREETLRAIRSDLPLAALQLRNLLKNSAHKDHFGAIKLLAAINSLATTHQTTEVTHKIDRAELEQRALKILGRYEEQIIDVTPQITHKRDLVKSDFDP